MPMNLPPRPAPSVWLNAARFFALCLLMKAGCFASIEPEPPLFPAKVAPAIYVTDAAPPTANGYPAGALVPEKPLEGQETRKDRCMVRAATYINGGCWVALQVAPPCVPGSFQHGNTCYAPQSRSPDVPVSVTR